MSEAKTHEEEDAINAMNVIANSIRSLVTRVDDSKKAQRVASDRYAVDLTKFMQTNDEINKENTALLIQNEELSIQNVELLAQLEAIKLETQLKVESIITKSVSEIEALKIKMQKQIDNLQAVADTALEYKEQAKSAQQAEKNFIKQLDDQKTNLDQKNIEIRNQTSELTKQTALITKLESDKLALQTRLESSNDIKGQAIGELKATNAQARHMQEEIADFSSKLNAELLKNFNLSKRIEELEKIIKAKEVK
jgi:chromosome segregation ATPase